MVVVASEILLIYYYRENFGVNIAEVYNGKPIDNSGDNWMTVKIF